MFTFDLWRIRPLLMIFFGVTSFTQGTWVCTYLIMMPINAVNLSVLNNMSSVWLRSSCIFLSSIHALPMRCLSSDIFWGILAWHVDTSVQPPLHSGRGDIPELGPKPVPPKASLFRDRFYRDEHPFTSFFCCSTQRFQHCCPAHLTSFVPWSKNGLFSQKRVWPSSK